MTAWGASMGDTVKWLTKCRDLNSIPLGISLYHRWCNRRIHSVTGDKDSAASRCGVVARNDVAGDNGVRIKLNATSLWHRRRNPLDRRWGPSRNPSGKFTRGRDIFRDDFEDGMRALLTQQRADPGELGIVVIFQIARIFLTDCVSAMIDFRNDSIFYDQIIGVQ